MAPLHNVGSAFEMKIVIARINLAQFIGIKAWSIRLTC